MLHQLRLLLRDLKDPSSQPKYPRIFEENKTIYIYTVRVLTRNAWMHVEYTSLELGFGTYDDFPLPVGPRIAFRPGLIIPLQDNNTHAQVYLAS